MHISRQPLISCLCVTQNKPEYLSRAINCFANQTYLNKELVIVYEDNNLDGAAFLSSLDFKKKYRRHIIKHIEVSSTPKLTLGQLRNLSIEKAAGEYFCQWDDDDWYHPMRLQIQYQAAQQRHSSGSILRHWIMYDSLNKGAYISFDREWEGSILCRKDVINEEIKYPLLSKAEDSGFYKVLKRKHLITPLMFPYLYIYTFHSSNTWDKRHFDFLFRDSKKLSGKISEQIANLLSTSNSSVADQEIFSDGQLFAEIEEYIGNQYNQRL